MLTSSSSYAYFTQTLNRDPDMNQLSRLALNVYCMYQDATDQVVAVLYFCGINVSFDASP
jgi:hypothetical protein